VDKIEALFVRAIKGNSDCSCSFKVKRIYQRFYNNKYQKEYLAGILCGIVEKYELLSVRSLCSSLHPDNSWRYNESISYNEKLASIFMSAIRCAPISKFKDFPIPGYWRNKQ